MTIDDNLIQPGINIENYLPLLDVGLEKLATWRKKPKSAAFTYISAVLVAALIFKHSDKLIDAANAYGGRVGFSDMTLAEKTLHVSNILQVIPTIGAPLMHFFGYDNTNVDKLFILINNLVNIVQAGGGMSSILKALLSAVKR
jgi:hypothetical protein